MHIRTGPVTTSPALDSTRRWPFTIEAWRRLDAELVDLALEVDELERQRSSKDGCGSDTSGVVSWPTVQARSRLERLRVVLEDAAIEDGQGRAVIGRGVVVREDDGSQETYTLAPPGEGAPSQGRIAADSPLGAVLLGCRAGDTIEVDAPAGSRRITVEHVE